jgi:hypothetical protein
LKTPRLTGRPLKIITAQMRWLYRTITGKSPLRFRFEFALWTREMIQVSPVSISGSTPIVQECIGENQFPAEN